MIVGRVTADREAVVPVPVEAADGQSHAIEAVIDTGFTEFLALPSARIASLHLPLAGLQRMTLADGTVAVLAVYEVGVHWHGARRTVQVLEVEGGALLGMALLDGSRMTMDVCAGGEVSIEPMAAP